MQVNALSLDAPSWDVLLDAVASVSRANVAILESLPIVQDKISILNKESCIAVVEKLQEDTEQICEDVDKEARIKLLFELQQIVQGVVVTMTEIIDAHDLLTGHVDAIIEVITPRRRKMTESESESS